jgi:Tol biopolymer transport system component
LARPLAGTEHARFPFWSPDSRSVGFTAQGQLKRIDIDTGGVRVLAPAFGGGTWSQDGTILFDRGPGAGLYRVSATGGEPRLAAQIDMRTNDPWHPKFLPDQRHFLFYETGAMPGIYLGQLDSEDAPRRLLDAQVATYAAPGHLIFARQRTLFAQPFDPVRLELSGNPAVVAEQLVVGENPGTAALSASAAGPVVYRTGPGGVQSQFVWFDRSGKAPEAVPGSDIGDGFNSALSPDGRRLAFSRFADDTPGKTTDIWLLDVARGVASRFTSDPMFDLTPVWSPNGDRLAFASNRKRADGSTGSFDVYAKAATGLGNEDRLVGHDLGDPPSDWSPDGRFILYNRESRDNSNDIWGLPLAGDRQPFPVVETKFAESNGQFSPDGKWIAFQSNESGQVEVYVQPFPGPGRRTRITRDGGDQARWRHDGKELFYLTPDDRLMAVPMQLDAERDTVDAGMPQMLFALRVNGVPRHPYGRHYSVSRDGQRFLVDTLKEVTLPITVVLNWKPTP